MSESVRVVFEKQIKYISNILNFMMKYFLKAFIIFFIFIGQFLYAGINRQNKYLPVKWHKIASGIWKTDIGEKQDFDLLTAAGIKPDFKTLNEKKDLNFPLDQSLIKAENLNGKIYLRIPLDSTEQIYGLGLQFKSINRRGKVYRLHVDNYGGVDNGRTHAPVPFYVTSRGYGVLINSARYITVYAGTTVRVDDPVQPPVRDRNTDKKWTSQPESDAVEILIPASGVEVFIFAGNSPMDAVSRYNLFCGGGVLPPKWGLGFTYRTPSLFNQEQVLNEVKEFEKHGFPLDFIGLEPGWQSASYPCTYVWDKGRFPQPEKLVGDLLKLNVRANLWLNPYVSPESPIYKSILPFAGSHEVWNGIVPDYSMPETRKIFTDFFRKENLDIGVSGVKIDECDGFDKWLWPDVATFPSGLDAEQIRQTYGVMLQRMFADMYRKKNERTFGLVRASNAGASSLPFVIYNDYYNHQDFITALINSGFCGILWTPEARSSKSAEEWVRRIQSVCFSPLAMINAWSSGTKPWSYPDVYPSVQEVAELRMSLLPYIYTAFAEYHFKGIPPVRPMQLIDNEFTNKNSSAGKLDDTENSYKEALKKDIKDQYMFGDFILVAPMFAGQTSREVLLPPGKWYDFYTGKFAGQNGTIVVKPGLDKIPLFVKDGGIIPMISARLHMPSKGEVIPLTIRYYGSKPGRFMLYDDDGVSYNYEKGDYSWTELSVAKKADGKLRGNVKRPANKIYNYGNAEWVFMTKQ